MNLKKWIWLTVIVTMQPFVSAFAHPGHGHKEIDGNSVLHYLTEYVHVVSFAVIVVLFFVGRYYFLRRQKQYRVKDDNS